MSGCTRQGQAPPVRTDSRAAGFGARFAGTRFGTAAALASISVAAACSPAQNGTVDGSHPPSAVVDADSYIEMQRLPCFGTCPVYSVRIVADGTVTFDGERFVEATGVSTATIEPAAAAHLMHELVAGGFNELPARYTHDAKDCGSYHTDAPRVILTLRMSGREKTVEHDYGCSDAPESLRRMQTLVDSVAGVARWIGSRGY